MLRVSKWVWVAAAAVVVLAVWFFGGWGQSGANKRAAIAVTVKLAKAGRTNFPLIERGFGSMASPQVVAINARVSSQITKVNVTDGQMVKKGDVLIELDDRALQATLAKDQATTIKDQTTLANNELQLERARTLLQKNAGSQQDVDNALTTQKAQAKLVESDKAIEDNDRLQLDFTKITAPIDGKLGTVTAVTGQLVAASTNSVPTSSLMTVTQMQPLKVVFRLPELVLGPLQSAMASGTKGKVRVRASGTNNVLGEGTLDFVDSAVDASSGTIGLGATVPNEKLALWPGQRVDIELEYGDIKNALTVPTVAVQQGQNGPYVWVVDDKNKAKAVNVKVARYEGEFASISEGISEDAQVVVEGQAKLANGSDVKTADAKPAGTNPNDAKPAEAKTDAKTNESGAQAATPSDKK